MVHALANVLAMKEEQLQQKSRVDLQALAKQNNIKANGKTQDIIEQLLDTYKPHTIKKPLRRRKTQEKDIPEESDSSNSTYERTRNSSRVRRASTNIKKRRRKSEATIRSRLSRAAPAAHTGHMQNDHTGDVVVRRMSTRLKIARIRAAKDAGASPAGIDTSAARPNGRRMGPALAAPAELADSQALPDNALILAAGSTTGGRDSLKRKRDEDREFEEELAEVAKKRKLKGKGRAVPGEESMLVPQAQGQHATHLDTQELVQNALHLQNIGAQAAEGSTNEENPFDLPDYKTPTPPPSPGLISAHRANEILRSLTKLANDHARIADKIEEVKLLVEMVNKRNREYLKALKMLQRKRKVAERFFLMVNKKRLSEIGMPNPEESGEEELSQYVDVEDNDGLSALHVGPRACPSAQAGAGVPQGNKERGNGKSGKEVDDVPVAGSSGPSQFAAEHDKAEPLDAAPASVKITQVEVGIAGAVTEVQDTADVTSMISAPLRSKKRKRASDGNTSVSDQPSRKRVRAAREESDASGA